MKIGHAAEGQRCTLCAMGKVERTVLQTPRIYRGDMPVEVRGQIALPACDLCGEVFPTPADWAIIELTGGVAAA